MKKVITYGTYDLLHFGHIRLLERAKALGDYLIVGVTADGFDRARGKINVQQSLMERIEAAIPNSEFRIFGGGNAKENCVQLAENLGLKNVVFDQVSRDKVAFVQSQADVLILALPKGNGNLCLPSKMTSYMLSGKPVLASVDHDSATTRYIHEADCGISVKPDDIQAIKGGFIQFAQMDKQELNQKGENAKGFSRQHLTREVNIKLVVTRIKEIISSFDNIS